MSTPENKIAETIHAVEGVVKAIPVYQDAVQPAAKEIGTALQTVTKCVNVALAPISALVWGYDKIKQFVDTSVSERLSRIPPDRIVTPKPEVAGPALEALRYTGHDNDLRDLFANLLAAAMDSETASKAHPGFVEIIKNLSPDEARIMRLFASVRSRPAVLIRRRVSKNPNEFREILRNYSVIRGF